VPITNLFLLVEALFVNTSLGVNSVADLKALVQQKPARSISARWAGLLSGPVPALDEQRVAGRHRRHPVSRRRPDRHPSWWPASFRSPRWGWGIFSA